jgi:hypothetical protein
MLLKYTLPGEAPQSVELPADRVFKIGSAPASDVVIAASGVHPLQCGLMTQDGKLQIVASKQSQQIALNGKNVARALLKPGDYFQVGPVSFLLAESAEAAPAAAAADDQDEFELAPMDDEAPKSKGAPKSTPTAKPTEKPKSGLLGKAGSTGKTPKKPAASDDDDVLSLADEPDEPKAKQTPNPSGSGSAKAVPSATPVSQPMGLGGGDPFGLDGGSGSGGGLGLGGGGGGDFGLGGGSGDPIADALGLAPSSDLGLGGSSGGLGLGASGGLGPSAGLGGLSGDIMSAPAPPPPAEPSFLSKFFASKIVGQITALALILVAGGIIVGVALSQPTADDRFAEATAAFESGQFDSAQTQLAAYLSSYPRSAGADEARIKQGLVQLKPLYDKRSWTELLPAMVTTLDAWGPLAFHPQAQEQLATMLPPLSERLVDRAESTPTATDRAKDATTALTLARQYLPPETYRAKNLSGLDERLFVLTRRQTEAAALADTIAAMKAAGAKKDEAAAERARQALLADYPSLLDRADLVQAMEPIAASIAARVTVSPLEESETALPSWLSDAGSLVPTPTEEQATEPRLVLTARGELHQIDPDGKRWVWNLPDAPVTEPVFAAGKGLWAVVGEQAHAYVLSTEDRTCKSVVAVGHLPGTAHAAAWMGSTFLLVASDDGFGRTRISVLDPLRSKRPVQTTTIDGWYTDWAFASGSVAVLTDNGTLVIYDERSVSPPLVENTRIRLPAQPAGLEREMIVLPPRTSGTAEFLVCGDGLHPCILGASSSQKIMATRPLLAGATVLAIEPGPSRDDPQWLHVSVASDDPLRPETRTVPWLASGSLPPEAFVPTSARLAAPPLAGSPTKLWLTDGRLLELTQGAEPRLVATAPIPASLAEGGRLVQLNGDVIAIPGSGSDTLWRFASGESKATAVPLAGEIASAAVSTSDEPAWIALASGVIYRLDLATAKPIGAPLILPYDSAEPPRWTLLSDSKLGANTAIAYDGHRRLLTLEAGETIQVAQDVTLAEPVDAVALLISGDTVSVVTARSAAESTTVVAYRGVALEATEPLELAGRMVLGPSESAADLVVTATGQAHILDVSQGLNATSGQLPLGTPVGAISWDDEFVLAMAEGGVVAIERPAAQGEAVVRVGQAPSPISAIIKIPAAMPELLVVAPSGQSWRVAPQSLGQPSVAAAP